MRLLPKYYVTQKPEEGISLGYSRCERGLNAPRHPQDTQPQL